MIRQIKIFSNPSLIVLEDLMNDWFYNHSDTVKVISTKEIRNVEQPTFLIEYTVTPENVTRKANVFQLTTKPKTK